MLGPIGSAILAFIGYKQTDKKDIYIYYKYRVVNLKIFS